MCAQLLLSCLTLSDPMDLSPLGSSVHGILQASNSQVLGPISNSSTYFYHLIFLLFLSHGKTGNVLLNYWHNL